MRSKIKIRPKQKEGRIKRTIVKFSNRKYMPSILHLPTSMVVMAKSARSY